MSTSDVSNDSGKQYHKTCTGVALQTAKSHSTLEDITLFGSCFCPFVQRVWVALEYLGIPYYYYEVDPYQKPRDLLDVSPKGLVPALKLNNYNPPRALNESTVIMEFLEEISWNSTKRTLFPPISDPYARAQIRLQSDFVNRSVIPAFSRFLQAQNEETQIDGGKEFHDVLQQLARMLENSAEDGTTGTIGLWKDEGTLGWTDVMIGPWIFRASNVLKHYRGFEMPSGIKFSAWLERLFEHPAFKATCSTEELYLDSYERYAYNRPNTSQVANAINSGRGLP